MKRLKANTLVVLKKPYNIGGDKQVQDGRIYESLSNDRYGIRFQGYENSHGPITVDFSRKEFTVAKLEK